MFERFGDRAKYLVVVRRFVAADRLPVNSLGGVFRIRVMFDNLRVAALGFGPVFLHKGNAAEARCQTGAKIFLWQIALEPPSFLAVRVHNEHRRRPDSLKAVKVFWIFLDVNFERDKVFVDEGRQTGVVVRLVFESLTGSSGRRGAEIDQQRLFLFFGPVQRLIGVFDPID